MAVEVQRRGGAGTAMQRRMGSTPGLDGLALGSLFFLVFFLRLPRRATGVRHGKS